MHTQAISTQQDAWVQRAVNRAIGSIAPVWPLDQSIAVNPWWTMRDEPISQVAAKLQYLGNVNMLMDKSYYASAWGSQITAEHLTQAAASLNINADENTLLAYLAHENEKVPTWRHVADLLDQQVCHTHKMPWRDEIIQQMSQFTALYFQYPERMQPNNDAHNGFYKAWLEVTQQDKGIEILMVEPGLHVQFEALPDNLNDLFSLAKETLGNAADEVSFMQYCHALLLDINGWASWMASQAWQAAFANEPNNLLQQLLAVRLAWDMVLWRYSTEKSPDKFTVVREVFINQLTSAKAQEQATLAQQNFGWVWQTALELSYQQPLYNKLINQLNTHKKLDQYRRTEAHAIFCIDVRSEPMRRALESQNSTIKTSGFAGFFGLPIEYAIKDSRFIRPQLPGLLKASISATQVNHVKAGSGLLFKLVAAKKSADTSPSAFGVIEAKGLLKAASLFKSSFFPSRPKAGIESLMTNGNWTLTASNKPLDDAALAGLAAGIMRAMNLLDNFAKRVLFVGHASCTTNNPHAAGLDCGACGGQSGEVNVRVLAQVLNSEGVRVALKYHDIYIPEDTKFVACLHNTTTDEIQVFGDTDVFANESWTKWLLAATATAQKKRSASVGITHADDAGLLKNKYAQKANNWAQLRPEWGLANNAAFIVAPRDLTINIDLEGRSFLHDYDWKKDTDFSILELIITAPMVVTNWINLQYYASVTDNQKYGSGNKLLHNVVGGNIGVFEGNGGDLRIGLPFQSVHDGVQWRHQPLRLSVYLAAPKEAITSIIVRHQHINDLIRNNWLYLFQLDADNKTIVQLKNNHWEAVDGAVLPS